MASMKDIKRRKGSIQNTQQITKAMKLVSTVKLQKARVRAEKTNPYFEQMYKTVVGILSQSGDIIHPYLQPGDSDKKAVIVLTSNRGLAGGYNTSVSKLLMENDLEPDQVKVYAIGAKGRDYLNHRGYHIERDYSDELEEASYTKAQEVCDEILGAYAKGEVGEIYLAYTHFKNTVVHEPTLLKLLPVSVDESELEGAQGSKALMTYEPNEEEALDLIIPKYVTSILYGGLVEAEASENGARMQAMDAATSNADDMISDLSLKYNRARQGAITQEITEIIAGANAIS